MNPPRRHQPRAEAQADSLMRPPPLHAGDKVALISPSSHLGDHSPQLRRRAAEILSAWGLEVVNRDSEERRHIYLAGTDAERAAEFESHYCDPDIKALFFTRGGYGAGRMLPMLHGERLAAAPPKAVVGFSDATALFAYLHTVAKVSVLHGPCLAAPGFLDHPPATEELQALRRALFDPEHRPTFRLSALDNVSTAFPPAEGPVLGGSLAVFLTTVGTAWEPDCRGAILFLEDTNEVPYRIDRMLTHLRAAGKFEHLAGLVLGYFNECDGDPPGLLQQVIEDLFCDAPFPVAQGLPAGHGSPNLTLPLGQPARLEQDGASPDSRTLSFLR